MTTWNEGQFVAEGYTLCEKCRMVYFSRDARGDVSYHECLPEHRIAALETALREMAGVLAEARDHLYEKQDWARVRDMSREVLARHAKILETT